VISEQQQQFFEQAGGGPLGNAGRGTTAAGSQKPIGRFIRAHLVLAKVSH